MEKPPCINLEASTPLTTFVQADIDTFRELVQRLTGASDADLDNKPHVEKEALNEGTSQRMIGTKRSTSTLHKRRTQYTGSKLEIVKPSVQQFRPCSRTSSPSKSEMLFSPSKSYKSGFITSPARSFSEVSIREEDKEREFALNLNRDDEEKAITERRFYLHPSTRPKQEDGEPELLPLFPLTSPKGDES